MNPTPRLRIAALLVGLALALSSCATGPQDATGASSASPTPSASPTASPSISPSADPTMEPTPAPASSPTMEPTPAPASSPTAEPVPAIDCTISKCVALIYDDGPSPLTNELLDVLAGRGVHVTFFLNGQYASNNPEVVLRAFELGHEIGNHTTNHTHLPQQPPDRIDFEIADTQQRIQQITGQWPTLLRPPYGDRNTAVDQIAGQHGLAVINWSDGPADWENHDAARVAELTVAVTRPGSIILLHDTHRWTVDAAGPSIDALRAQGYEFVTVSQLLGTPMPGQFYTNGPAPA